jgi:histidine triad (HIT) family protein
VIGSLLLEREPETAAAQRELASDDFMFAFLQHGWVHRLGCWPSSTAAREAVLDPLRAQRLTTTEGPPSWSRASSKTVRMPDCVFCQIVAREASAHIVAEDDSTVAFLDRGQATEGHTLVVPRSHASDLWDVSDEDAAAVMVMAKRIANTLERQLAPDGLNLMQSNRAAGWQDVFHFHVHVIPRWSDDRLVRPWQPTRTSDEQLAATFERLR